MNSKFQKLFIILFSIAILGATFALGNVIVGDVNQDGIVTEEDITFIVENILKGEMSDCDAERCDLNQDGKVSACDLVIAINNLTDPNELPQNKDTLYITYSNESVSLRNPDESVFEITQTSNDIEVLIKGESIERVVSLSGKCDDGRIRVIADTTYTLLLAGIDLTSSHAPAINSSSKQKMTLKLQKGTENYLTDAKKYVFPDMEEQANACFCSQGNITIEGKGVLTINGKSKHGIASGKGMRLKNGTINVLSAPSDALHSGKYIHLEGATLNLQGQKQDGMDADEEVEITGGLANITTSGKDVKSIKCGTSFTMTDGTLEMQIDGDASKGVKAKENIIISGGKIISEALGNVVITKGDPSYCTIIKGDSCVMVTGGEMALVHKGMGGKCLSADRNLIISDGTLYLETSGDGAEYINANDEADYYTSKCISVDDSLFIERGEIRCQSAGLGGKGIVADEYIAIGLSSDTLTNELGPTIVVDTKGTCIIDNVDEDLRFGCPKGIKSNNMFKLFSGDICVTTAGMGGEGIESNDELYIYGGQLECNTFDDGINVGNKIEICGGVVYCNSSDNDGIDSNGSIYLKGGVVVATNQTRPNESFDSENSQLYLLGATVIGIGSCEVNIGSSDYPYYNTPAETHPLYKTDIGIDLSYDKYLCVVAHGTIIAALKNKNRGSHGAYITVSSPFFFEGSMCSFYEGDQPVSVESSFFADKLILGGSLQNEVLLFDYFPTSK